MKSPLYSEGTVFIFPVEKDVSRYPIDNKERVKFGETIEFH